MPGGGVERARARRHGLATWPPSAAATIALAGLVALVVLGFVVALAVLGDHPFAYYSIDPARTLSASPLVGLMSHVGVLLTWAASATCLFAGAFVARARGVRRAGPLLAAGAGTAYLALDDLFLLHENIYPDWFGIPQKVVLITYAVGALAFLWFYRDFFRKQEWPLLALAVVVLAAAMALDFELRNLLGNEALKRWMEDGVKLFGLAFLAAYLVRLSARMLADAYSVSVREQAETGPERARESPMARVAEDSIRQEA